MHPHFLRMNPSVFRRVLSAAAALLLTLGAGGCADDALLSPSGPRLDGETGTPITLTSDTAVVGDTGVVVTVRGTGFNQFVWVSFDPWIYAIPTLVDDSTLSVRVPGPLQGPSVHQLSVMYESGEWSAPATFSVVNPVPVIERISPESCDTGSYCGPITVHGRNFVQGAIVQWNNSYVWAQFQSDSVLVLQPDPYFLQNPDLVQVRVHNPGPGGGTSGPVLFQVGLRIVMHTAGARAGGPGFELEIYGESFSSGATVYWNGSPRQTTYSNPRRVSAWIPASDVAAPGEGVVTLSTWQLNQGQPFPVGTITVRPQPSATVTSQLTLGLPVRDVAYSAYTQRLYGTVYQGPDAGNVAVIDPQTGTVENLVWIGSSPRYLAVSDDGRYLWVGVDGENTVRRVNLEYAWSDITVYLDSLVAADLAAVPGNPLAVAVVRKDPYSGRNAGVAVYEGYGGSMRPSVTGKDESSNLIAFGAKGSTLFGLRTGSGDNRYRTMTVNDNGVAVTATGWNVGTSLAADLVFAGGRLYTSDGHTIDTGYNDWAGFFNINNTNGAVRPDVRTGRAFFLNESGIRVTDINTFATAGMLPVPPLQFESPTTLQRRHLVRWGADGLAYHDADEVFILRSPIVGP